MSEQATPTIPDTMLTIGISTGALFDMREADGIFLRRGSGAYLEHMRETKDIPLLPGHAFDFIATLARLERDHGHTFASIKIISRNDPITAERLLNSMEYYRLKCTSALYTSGKDPVIFLPDYAVDWFITTHAEDAKNALAAGVGACAIDSPRNAMKIKPAFNARGKARRIGYELPLHCEDKTLLGKEELHTVFDLDQVAFDGVSDAFYQSTNDTHAYFMNEREKMNLPCGKGPLFPVLEKLSFFARHFEEAGQRSPIINSVLTVRAAEAMIRGIRSINTHGLRINGYTMAVGCGVMREGRRAFRNPGFKDIFLKRMMEQSPKAAFLFMDDSASTIARAKDVCPSGLVPGAGTIAIADVKIK